MCVFSGGSRGGGFSRGGSSDARGGSRGGFGGGAGGGYGAAPDYGNGDVGDKITMPDSVFVSGFPPMTTESDLAAHFGQIGVIKTDKRTGLPKIWMFKDKATGMGKGEATITYEDENAASAAINWFHNQEFQGCKLSVSLATRKPNQWDTGMRGGRGGGRGGDRGGPRGGGGFGGGRGGGDRGGRGGGPPPQGGAPRAGDWICPNPSCGNNNFAWRDACNKCQTPKGRGGDRDDGGYGGGRGGFGGGDRGRGGFGDRGGRGGDRGGRGRGGGGDRGGRGRGGPMRGGDRGRDRPRPY